jgi:alpha-tubulin suppressor-like RCC1 family protein
MMNASNSTQQIPLSSRSTSSLLVTSVAALFAAIVVLLVAVQRTDAQVQGEAWAWGQNEYGQLGDGTNTNRNAPVQVRGLSGVQDIDAGFFGHSLALKSDGTVWAWGRNKYGQLGVAGTTQRNFPVQVSGLSGVRAIGAGHSHSLAVTS